MDYRTSVAAQIRAGNTGAPSIEGLAARYNSISHGLGGCRERLRPGAFEKALREQHDVRALVNHDPSLLLGRTKSGTLRLWDPPEGLAFRVELPDTQYGHDVYEAIKRGDMDQCSFSFRVDEGAEDWTTEKIDPDSGEVDPEDGEASSIRTLRSVRLFDVSAVTYPAYESTRVKATPPISVS